MTYARKVDTPTSEIVSALQAQGWLWVDTSKLGNGFPDGLACKAGRIVLVEIKSRTPSGKIKDRTWKQIQRHLELSRFGVRVEILTCEADLEVLERPQRARAWG